MTNDITASAAAAREAARSSDGKFGTQPAAEAEIDLAPAPAGTPIKLEPGDADMVFPEILDATVMDWVEITHDEQTGVYWAYGHQDFRYCDFAPEMDDEEQREAWGEKHRELIADVLTDRYPGASVVQDGQEGNIEFEYNLGTSPTEQAAVDAMSKGPAVDFYNESDAGSNGHEYLGRIIQEKIDRSVVVEDADEARLLAGNLRASGLHLDGPFGGNVTDQLAMATAVEAAQAGDCPELRQFSREGYGEHARMVEELDDLDAAGVLEEDMVRSMRIYLDRKDPAKRERQS